MNQQTTNSCFTNSPSGLSAASSLSSLATPDQKAPAPPETLLPKAATRKSKSPAKANPSEAVRASAAPQEDARCRHYTSAGRRCRLTVLDPVSGLCFRHMGRQFQPSDEDLSPAFVGLLSGFDSPSRIHAFLTQVTVLLVQNRVSTRRAAVLTYLGQTLLRTLPAIELELNPPEEDQQILFDLPRPRSDEPEDPERATYRRLSNLYGTGAAPTDFDPSAAVTPTPGQTK